MYARQWSTSARQYDVVVDRDVRVRMPDGTQLDGDIYRPQADGRFPVILGAHPYNKELQSPPIRPVGFTLTRGWMESGDPTWFARRGYVHAIFNVRGTGSSEGFFQLGGPVEVQDVRDLIDWLAQQPWSAGQVAMFGVSYFARLAKFVAATNPEPLKAIFAPFAGHDYYRHSWYHGGILAPAFLAHWRFSLHRPRVRSLYKQLIGETTYLAALARALQDPDVMAVQPLREALQAPDVGTNPLLVDVVLNPLDGPFYAERRGNDAAAHVPAYLGGCWGIYGLHLPGAFPAWRDWAGPKKMVIGPPVYLDRPLYQYHEEALRWFDYWLKGVPNGIMDEPPIRCFIPPTGEWQALDDWPPAAARWTTFFFHEGGLLSEHDPWPSESATTFEDSPFAHGELTYDTPPLVENTEVLGPSVVTLYLSTTDTDALLFVTLLAVDHEDREHELTRGWLRASQREVRDGSPRWDPELTHRQREPLTPGEVYELRIPVVATARLFRAGERMRVRIKAADDEPAAHSLQAIARNHLRRQKAARITVHHSGRYPSGIDVPVTRGNLVGTYVSGGDIVSSYVPR